MRSTMDDVIVDVSHRCLFVIGFLLLDVFSFLDVPFLCPPVMIIIAVLSGHSLDDPYSSQYRHS